MKTSDTADFITLLKLAEHVSRIAGPHLAIHEMREKSLAGEIRLMARWLAEDPFQRLLYARPPGVPAPHRDEAAPPQFLVDLENRGIPFKEMVSLSEHGIYFEPGKTAYLFASRADAARFWPSDDLYGRGRITGRKVRPGAPAVYDWEKALVEAARYCHENGVPKRQARLVGHILEWFGEPGPSETQVKEHLAPLYAALRDASPKASKSSSGK
jgi:hypothetical protein